MSTKLNEDVASTSNVQQQRQCQDEDLSLRPPLPTTVQESHDQELRSLLCRMFVASNTLRIGSETRFTALVLLHRFHAAISSAKTVDNDNITERLNKGWAAAACIFLACKAEEEPRRLRDIINVAHMIFQEEPSEETNETGEKSLGKAYGTDSQSTAKVTLHVSQEPPSLNENYWATKEKIVFIEQVVLRWLGFDVSVSGPFRVVALLVKEARLLDVLHRWNVQPDQIVPVAWRRLNDAVFYAKALQHSALVLACASIELALEEINSDVLTSSKTCPWWHQLGVSNDSVALVKQHLNIASESLKASGVDNSGICNGTE